VSKRNLKQDKERIPDYLLHIAQGFYDIGFNAAYNVHVDNSVKGFQRLPAAVVNFNFAVELMLKALHLFTTGKNLEGHEIWVLFKHLPQETKIEIESRFEEFRKQKNEKLSSYRVKLTRGDNEEKVNKNTENLSLKDFLVLHNHSFVNWRYLYEIQEEGYLYEYNFKQMDDFVKALIETINDRRSKRPPSMLLEKN
jgi:hypothetical protein